MNRVAPLFEFVPSHQCLSLEDETQTNRHPPVIRFRPDLHLSQRILRVDRSVFTKQIPSDFCEIPAIQSNGFFRAVREIAQDDGAAAKIRNCFHPALNDLHDYYYNHHFSDLEPKDCVKLGQLFLENGKAREAIFWICLARRHLSPSQSLAPFLDLDEFFASFQAIHSWTPFVMENCEEVIAAMAASPSIERLVFFSPLDYTLENAARIGELLKRTNSIRFVHLGHCWHRQNNKKLLNDNTIEPIVSALKWNQSIEELDLSETEITDAGLHRLIAALRANPRHRIHTINLDGCPVSDKAKQELIPYLKEKCPS